MTVLLFRIFLLLALAIITYSVIKYLTDSRRRLERARRRGEMYVYDDPREVRRNLLITSGGALFEGEKYLGTAETSVEVTSIQLQTEDTVELNGMTLQDFHQIEKELQLRYPKAVIQWREPTAGMIRRLRRKQEAADTAPPTDA
ncbi:sigma-w pathway protein ysdB [Alkalicoccus urumqiensis]|uniref:Sigma-w pathway protein ysdB n=1 Tax=Alkalicoccus urumqiensis TaxID=1548213 RepID=A0A2P6MFB6_ALKUR|nr:sigma-w pathway protein ysdB [Alkalicoccus urumqiensis]